MSRVRNLPKEKKFLFQKFLERDLTNMCCDLQSRNTWQYFLRCCCCKDLLSLLIREILFLLLLPKLIGRQWAEQLSLKIISMIPLKGWLYDWTSHIKQQRLIGNIYDAWNDNSKTFGLTLPDQTIGLGRMLLEQKSVYHPFVSLVFLSFISGH